VGPFGPASAGNETPASPGTCADDVWSTAGPFAGDSDPRSLRVHATHSSAAISKQANGLRFGTPLLVTHSSLRTKRMRTGGVLPAVGCPAASSAGSNVTFERAHNEARFANP